MASAAATAHAASDVHRDIYLQELRKQRDGAYLHCWEQAAICFPRVYL